MVTLPISRFPPQNPILDQSPRAPRPSPKEASRRQSHWTSGKDRKGRAARQELYLRGIHSSSILPQEQHQNVVVPRRSNQTQGGSLRKDQQGGQNSKATVKAPRTTHSRATQSRATSRRETIPAAAPYRKTSQKGKAIAGESSRVWKQKEIVKTPRLEGTNSKSTGESSIPIGRKSNSSGKRSVPCSRATSPPEANRDLVSVFERLGNAEPNSLCIAEHDRAAEARSSHSKDSSNHKESQEGRSSKGSRSPPSVFERLGSHSQNTAEGTKNLREVLSSKRRRLSNSGDREAKKPRTETHEA
ncbi:hypothetical protein YC2023_081789 [Brassica napus]